MPYVGDVGWNSGEEINVARRGVNLGWPCYEGTEQQRGTGHCRSARRCFTGYGAVQMPLVTWPHNGTGAAVLGGGHYTGTAFPSTYQGAYFYGDYGRGTFELFPYRHKRRADLGSASLSAPDWRGLLTFR